MSLVKYNNQLILLSKISIWCVGALGMGLGLSLDIERWSRAILFTSIPIKLTDSKLSKFSSDWCDEILAMLRPLLVYRLCCWCNQSSIIYLKMIDSLAIHAMRRYFFIPVKLQFCCRKNIKKGVCLVSNWQESSTSLIVVACKLLWFWCNGKTFK